MKLNELKKGDYFCIRPHHDEEVKPKQVYIKGDYNRTTKKYICGRCDDISYSREFHGCLDVYLDFTY